MLANLDGLHWNTLDSELFASLREQPCISSEFDNLPAPSGGKGLKDLVCKLKMDTSGPTQTAQQSVVTVYYLYGDERRAVRRFIEENTAFFESATYPFKRIGDGAFDPVIVGLFQEELAYMHRHGEIELGGDD